MAVRNKYFGAWKSSLPVISVSFCSLILVVVEEVIESEFKCPQNEDLKTVYGLSFFIFPALILLVLSLILQQDFIAWARCSKVYNSDSSPKPYNRVRCCEVVGKGVGSSLLWCVILLIDGRYSDCIHSAFKGNSTEPTVETTPIKPPSDAYILSQVYGLAALFVIILVYCLYALYPLWFCCADKKHREEIESQRILEEETQICISKEEKYVQEIVKNILVSKFQDRLKNVSNNLSIKGIFEEVKKFLNPPATPQTPGMEMEPLN